jgi:hypothetical protein
MTVRTGIRLTRPEPIRIIHFLSRDFDIHSPHAADNVHGQHDCAQDRQLAQDIRGALLALIHEEVDLGEIV